MQTSHKIEYRPRGNLKKTKIRARQSIRASKQTTRHKGDNRATRAKSTSRVYLYSTYKHDC